MFPPARSVILACVFAAALGAPVSAADFATTDAVAEARAALQKIYDKRLDLRQFFGSDGQVVPAKKASGLLTLEEWARRYGYKEHPRELAAYAPPDVEDELVPTALLPVPGAVIPTRKKGAAYNWRYQSAPIAIVLDAASRQVLLERRADEVKPIASLTKLMTAEVAVGQAPSWDGITYIKNSDEVGGARLRLQNGIPLTYRDVFYSMMVGSANNAANAIARLTGLAREDFVAQMNARARAAGLSRTRFTDPTGIDPANVSTAREAAALLIGALDQYEIRKAASTGFYDIQLAEGKHVLKNTNQILTNDRNGLTVLGGKTGYLNDVGWNLAVKMEDARKRPLVVVVIGAGTNTKSFNDAIRLARWTWQNYQWGK